MSSAQNARLADWIEDAAAERWSLERVDLDRYDAVATDETGILDDGTPVEVKGCAVEIVNGSTRCGRWWIRREPHEQLVEDGGAYALAVYDDHEILRLVLLDASTVDALLADRWTPCGDRHPADESAQLPWSAVLEDLEGPA